MKTRHRDSNIPGGGRLKGSWFLPASLPAAAPFTSAPLGRPRTALHSAVFFILEEVTNCSLKAVFSLQNCVFPSLLLPMATYQLCCPNFAALRGRASIYSSVIKGVKPDSAFAEHSATDSSYGSLGLCVLISKYCTQGLHF